MNCDFKNSSNSNVYHLLVNCEMTNQLAECTKLANSVIALKNRLITFENQPTTASQIFTRVHDKSLDVYECVVELAERLVKTISTRIWGEPEKKTFLDIKPDFLEQKLKSYERWFSATEQKMRIIAKKSNSPFVQSVKVMAQQFKIGARVMREAINAVDAEPSIIDLLSAKVEKSMIPYIDELSVSTHEKLASKLKSHTRRRVGNGTIKKAATTRLLKTKLSVYKSLPNVTYGCIRVMGLAAKVILKNKSNERAQIRPADGLFGLIAARSRPQRLLR